MQFLRNRLPVIIVFVVGITLVIQYYIPHPLSQEYLQETQRWNRIIKNFALLLGVVSLLGYHGKKVMEKKAGFGYSVLVFAAFVPMVFFGLWQGVDAPRQATATVRIPAEEIRTGGEYRTNIDLDPGDRVMLRQTEGTPVTVLRFAIESEIERSPETIAELERYREVKRQGRLVFLLTSNPGATQDAEIEIAVHGGRSVASWMFDYLKSPMESTMFSLLAFFIASAAFRAFRARTLDAAIMLGAAIIVMFGRISFGDMVSAWFSDKWLFFPKVTTWLMNVPTVAAKRAIFLGIALSVIATSVRIIFGIERSYLGRGENQ